MKALKTGICQLALIPVRKAPLQTSEQITQVIFGETFDITEENELWYNVRLHFDGYTGWISKKMATLIEKELPTQRVYIKDSVARLVLAGKQPEFIHIPGGSSLIPSETGFIGSDIFYTLDPLCALHHLGSKIELAEVALKFLHAPYLWGGRTIFGIDCSGLTQIVFKMNGIGIPRDAARQAEIGEPVQFAEDTRIGDLAFFDNADGDIIHTGIILGKSEIIHAAGKVRIDKFDHQGIFNEEDNAYSHKLRLIKRIIP
jgi:gamma-D-glutamyl-L-lysine dipeptidyl-peptidase